MKCERCGSYAINPGKFGRDEKSDLDLCDVCYWRKRAEAVLQCWDEAMNDVCELDATPESFSGNVVVQALRGLRQQRDEWKKRAEEAEASKETALLRAREIIANLASDLPDRTNAVEER